MIKVLPSLLSADFLKLGEEMTDMERSGADIFHLDVMDGQFVPNISYGIPVIRKIAEHASIPLDVHLMTEDPDQFINVFKEMGIDMVSFHIEATHHPHRTVQVIKQSGMKAGIALNPHTPITMIEHLLPDLDYVLVMTVNPGFGGQTFIESCLAKIKKLSNIKKEKQYDFQIEVDGGINDNTAQQCIDVGAELIVSGSFLFESDNRSETIKALRGR